jgi:hypothetical protein
MDEMFASDSPEINTFRTMFNNLPASPFEVALVETNFSHVGVNEVKARPSIYPNPTLNGWVYLNNPNSLVTEVDVYSNSGQWLFKKYITQTQTSIELPETKGTYLLVLKGYTERRVMKVVRN